ncbi:MAG: ribonuclease Z [Sphingobacteriaceae bacterium]|nr:ribonuclease Z [Sphingobacteriaceae bacterium]
MNRQKFELLILGSSAAIPTSERNQTSQILNICERWFLIDCGEATQIQLRKYKSKLQAINHIFISHLHGDHFFGLPGLLSSMHLLGRKTDIHIYAPENLKEFIDKALHVSESTLAFSIKWTFTKDDKLRLLFEDDKVEIFSFPLKHRIFCTGFLFKEKPLPRKIDKENLEKFGLCTADIPALRKGLDVINNSGKTVKNQKVTLDPFPSRSFAYCSDTIYNLEVVNHIINVDLLYHESTFLEDNLARAKKTFHSTAKQAAEIAKNAKAKKLILGHFSTRYPDLDQFLTESKTVFPNSELATDGKKFNI